MLIMRTLIASLLLLGFLVSCAEADDKPIKRKPRFTIGTETTYVTGPVDADGYIDYAAALNERLGKGIKSDDNANVLLWKAIGPQPGGKLPAEFYKWLGIAEPPERGDYFIDRWRFLPDRLKVQEEARIIAFDAQIEQAAQRPWTAKAQPEIAAWLKANEKPLDLVVEAVKRPHYFNPLVPAKTGKQLSGLVGAPHLGVEKCRDIGTALSARALLRLSEGRLDAAWQDLLACHRLGRQVARGGTLIEALVGYALDAVAGKADLAFLDGTKLTAKQLSECLRDLRKLPALSNVADKANLAERFVFLEYVMKLDRYGLGPLKDIAGTDAALMVEGKIDWDPALRNGNEWYDRLVATMRLKDRNEREKKFAQIKAELEKLQKSNSEPWGQLKILLAKDTLKAAGKAISVVMLSLIVPALHKMRETADRVEQMHANVQLAFALACYQREHGRYPKTLNALAVKYLPVVPQDLFSGKGLVYQLEEGGYLLYSVGVNGKDEEGRGPGDDPPGDDLVVRMPLPK
jgi:hypothetical protein